ncbi:MAG: endonuclease V [Thaumarchaeota archaeon]|nr:endonuclease V [Nitrososphaerota archaeon]MCL5317317.1 endonuclease V [Nitrososphaerota archaeon]
MLKPDTHLNNFLKQIQSRISEVPPKRYVEAEDVKHFCGVDISYKADRAAAAAVLRSIRSGEIVETKIVQGEPPFPYIPGLLFMREAPLMTAAVKALSKQPDVILVDGHGIAHPRRAGLAVFVGLTLDTPSIGAAKSLLVGEIGESKNGFAPILLDGSPVGFQVDVGRRRPLFVSPGYGVRLESVREILSRLGAGFPKVLLEADKMSRASLR